MRADKYGRGPAATSCAFWNDFLPRLRNWGELELNLAVTCCVVYPPIRDNILVFNRLKPTESAIKERETNYRVEANLLIYVNEQICFLFLFKSNSDTMKPDTVEL